LKRVQVQPSLVLWLSMLFYLRPRLLGAFLLAAGLHELGHYGALVLLGRRPGGVTLSVLGAEMAVPALGYGRRLGRR
jgi:hypothetical protein